MAVQSFVSVRLAFDPISRCPEPLQRMASGVDDMVSCGARDPGLRRNPNETFAWQQFDPLQRLQNRLGAGGVVWSAMNPDGQVIGSGVDPLFLVPTGDRYERDGAN